MSSSAFFEHAAHPQLVISPADDRLIAANQLARDLLGLKGTTPLPRPSHLFAPAFPDFLVFSEAVIDKGRAWCSHLLVATPAGATRMEISGHCTQEEAGSLQLHLSLQTADELDQLREHAAAQRHYQSGIGHWNRVSKVFQEFERENQLLLDAAGEGIYGVDADGMTSFVNPAAQRILGYSAEELAGKNMHSLVHHSHGDGSHFSAEDCPIFEAFRDGTVHCVDDDVFWSKSGQRIDVEYTSTPVRDNGQIIGAVVIFRDVSQKKADKQRLLAALDEVQALRHRLELENAYLQEEIGSEFNHHRIIGKSPALQHLIDKIQLVAPTTATVLVCGESGTGKELIARAIHDESERSERPLIRVNCAAIPTELFESEFFGHSKGAFTGATRDRPGRFELADGGTLFLDEVGEIPLHLQGKLLRVLQEQQFERVGEASTRHVDVRIIAATNRDLKAAVAQGRFREDLYFRLNVFPIESVPLRQRLEDIPLLTHHFLKRACARVGKPELRIPLQDMEKLKRYPWPGNIRELENIIERQVILSRSNILHFPELQTETVADGLAVESTDTAQELIQQGIMTDAEVKQIDRRNLLNVLRECQGKVSGPQGAAKRLGVKPTTLTSRLRKYRIDPAQFREGYRHN